MQKLIKMGMALWFCSLSLFGGDASAIYHKKCAGCHGEDGKHKAFNRSPEIAGQPKEAILQKLNSFKEGDASLSNTAKVMKKQLQTLTERQIEDLASYISGL